MTVLVIQHVAVEGPGRIADALARSGVAARRIRTFAGEVVPRDVAAVPGLRGVVVMGGPMSVHDHATLAHLDDERALLAAAARADVPVLGICLGAQLLARALGAEVRRGHAIELGWREVTRRPATDDDALLGALPQRFTALHWHGEGFDVPAGATSLASSASTAHQAFRAGRAWGLLFHLEATAAQVAAMAATFPADLAAAGITEAALIAETTARTAEIADLADATFDRFAALL